MRISVTHNLSAIFVSGDGGISAQGHREGSESREEEGESREKEG